MDMTTTNRRRILIELFISRIGLVLQCVASEYMTTTAGLNHLQNSDPVIRDLFNLMGGAGRELGTAHKHELYDILQEAVVRALPGVTLAFRDGTNTEQSQDPV